MNDSYVFRFQNIKNFRPVANNWDKPCCYRCASLNKASKEEMIYLRDKLHIVMIIDLRTTFEREASPDVEIEGIENVHLPIFEQGEIHLPLLVEDFFKNDYKTMDKIYYEFASSKSCCEHFDQALAALKEAAPNASILFHCTSGKDRTGILAAMYMRYLGYNRKEIEKDYVRSNKANRSFAFKATLHTFFKTRSFKKAKVAYSFFHVNKKYLRPYLDN